MGKSIKMTDDGGHFWLDGKLFKAKRFRRGTPNEIMKGIHRVEYVEVDPSEYDKRIENLARRITSFPKVDLLEVLRDALYDETLDRLDRLEKLLDKEEAKAQEKSVEPRIETKRGERGTCVELRVAGRYGMNLRI